MTRLFRKLKPSDPLLTSRWFDIACGVTWLIYAVYALATMISPLATFTLAGAPSWYSMAWSGCLVATGIASATGAFWMFLDGRVGPLKKKRLERDSLWLLMSLIVIYEILLVEVVIHGSTERLAQIVYILSCLPLPLFRVYHLNRRIKMLLHPPIV